MEVRSTTCVWSCSAVSKTESGSNEYCSISAGCSCDDWAQLGTNCLFAASSSSDSDSPSDETRSSWMGYCLAASADSGRAAHGRSHVDFFVAAW
eukprot:scaffold12470_cov119-Isochrysis_galbana.AAC.18